MREVLLNGYIEEEAWFDDDITPGTLHDALYAEGTDPNEDVTIVLNSYGGVCNAATQMYDAIHAYPGRVNILISGTAASAATVVAMAADHLSMTPGSIFMIHDPSTACWGNIADFEETLRSLKATKESILNLYERRSTKERGELAQMMTDTCWMDANAALEAGFVDEIAEKPPEGVENAVFERRVSLEDAKAKFDAWRSRTRYPKRKDAAEKPEKPHAEVTPDSITISATDACAGKLSISAAEAESHTIQNPTDNRVKAADRMKRLALLKI